MFVPQSLYFQFIANATTSYMRNKVEPSKININFRDIENFIMYPTSFVYSVKLQVTYKPLINFQRFVIMNGCIY